ncbi:MAG: aminomuconate-semialdehyde/2-hydroxymuconate-6-semialdehyde dehydrogenase, partial [Cryomorphaceae bacterium]
MERIENFIDGDFVSPASGEYIANIDPSRGVQYGEIPDSDGKDVAAAVEAAERAFPAWSSLKGPERFAHLMNLAKGIERRMDEFVAAESKDNGKPVSSARMVDIPRAIQNFEFYASAAIHFSSESNFTEGLGINYTLRRPLGVVACISPWNLPLYLFTWKIAPALAAGNTIVAKPSEITPMTAYMLAQVVKEVNFPK